MITPLTSSSSLKSLRPPSLKTNKFGEDSNFPAVIMRQRNQPWSSIDLHEYKVYKAESSSDKFVEKATAAASTQTKDKQRRHKPVRTKEREEDEEEEEKVREEKSNAKCAMVKVRSSVGTQFRLHRQIQALKP